MEQIKELAESSAVTAPADEVITLDASTMSVIMKGERIALKAKEFALLECLYERKNTIVTKDELFEKALLVLQLAWKGHPDSLRHEVLDSVLRFIEIYDEEIDPDRLIFQLCQVDPIRIWEEGKKAGTRFSGYRRYLYQIYKQYIGMNPRIIEVIERSPLENYEYFKSNLGSSSSVLDSFDYDMYLPYTFNVRIEDPQYADEVSNYLQTLPGVSKVAKESRVMSVLTKATSFVNIATVASFIVLFIIALFIISNMVRISVYSRAYEIEIMKFVGATNMYIRVPFIIEGAIVGLISAGCAWVLSIIAYRSLFIKLMVGIDWSSYYALLPYKSLMWMVLALCVLMGVLIGAVGSGIAVRKYVKV